MYDTEGREWDLVCNSHRQILHMVEQGQLSWENGSARDAQRSKLVQRAERAEALGKSYGRAAPQGVGPFRGASHVLYIKQTDAGSALITTLTGSSGVHICVTCLRVRDQRHTLPDSECMRRMAHDNRVNKSGGQGQGGQGRQTEA